MAKKNGVNKSKAIRDYFKANPKAKSQDVVDALAKQGITTTVNYVSNLKASHNKRQRSVRKVVAKGGVGIPEVKAARGFSQDRRKRCGGQPGPYRGPGDTGDRIIVATDSPGGHKVNEYRITFTNGEVVEIEAWTPEAASVIAIEDAELEGRSGLSVAGVELLKARQIEL